MRKRNKGSKEVIIERDQLDSATCKMLKGAMNEEGKCVLIVSEDPKDSDNAILRNVNYNRSEEQ